MSSFRGIDVSAAPRLVAKLNSWPSMLEGAIILVNEAELLSDVSANVTGELDQIGTDGRAMGAGVNRAMASIVGHKLTLPSMGVGLLRRKREGQISGGQPWGGHLEDELALIRGTKTLGETAIATDRIDELVADINHDSSGGRDVVGSVTLLNNLLTSVFNGDTEVVAASTTALFSQGAAAADVVDLYAGGLDPALGEIAFVMANGLSPAEARLAPELLPARYVDWHGVDAERQRSQIVIDLNDEIWLAIDDGTIASPAVVAELESRLVQLDIDDERRHSIQLLLDSNNYLANFESSQRRAIREDLNGEIDAASAEIGRLTYLIADIQVPTLHDDASIDDSGRLRSFDAIGAAAVMMPRLPASFVGTSYATLRGEFDFGEVKRAVAFTARNSGAAEPFFEALGAIDAAGFMQSYQLEAALGGMNANDYRTSQLARDFSMTLGHASAALSPDFAVDLIETHPRNPGLAADRVAAEWAFAFGDFDPAFLVAGAAASLAMHGNPLGGGVTDYELELGLTHPSIVILEPVVAAGLGAEFVIELGKRDAVDSLVWADPAISAGVLHHLTNDPNPPLVAGIPLESHVLLQAKINEEASELLIDSAGSRLGALDLNIANGLSQVLAHHVPNFVGDDADSPYFDAAQNIFAAGTGVEIDTAIRLEVLQEIVDGHLYGDVDWFNDTTTATFAARIDARKFIVFENDAQLRDEAIRNTAAWISGLTTAAGISIGIVGTPVSGGASWAFTGAGAGASIGGWIAPMFADTPDNVEKFYRGEIGNGYNVIPNREAFALVGGILAGVATIAGGSVEVFDSDNANFVVLTTEAGKTQTWHVDWSDTSWVRDAQQAMDAAGVSWDVPLPDEMSTSLALNILANPSADAYGDEFLNATGLADSSAEPDAD